MKFKNATGGQTRLTQFEKMLLEVIEKFGNWRLPLDKLEMRMIIKHYFDDKNMEDSKFKDNFPREDLVNGFVKTQTNTIICQSCRGNCI